MKALIVGCGYVGMALGAELVRQGHEVHGLRRTRHGEEQMRGVGLQPVCGDITCRETFDRLPGDFDWIVNCTSATGGGAEEYRRVYVEGNRNLVDWLMLQFGAGTSSSPEVPGEHDLRDRDVPSSNLASRKLVYTSSTGVYGQNDGSTVDESSLTTPEAETAKNLVEAEQLLLGAAARGLPVVILRLAGIYGPGRGYWLKQFLAGEARLEGSGHRILNMIHLDDVVGSIIAALHRGAPGEVYNVVDDEPVTQLALFAWLSARLGRPMPPAGPPSAFRRGATNKRISNRRLRLELGHTLKYPSFREGFAAELEK